MKTRLVAARGPAPQTAEIAIIGAGIIGLACASRLREAGHEVVLIDPNPPGSGASYGNAGTIADYATQPVGTPQVLLSLPRLLFDRNSPLTIRHAALATLAPWLLRFAWQCLPGPAGRNARAIAALLGDAGPLWREFADQIGASHLLSAQGALYLYDSDKAARAAEKDLAGRRRVGVTVEMIGATELHRLEPSLQAHDYRAALFPGAIFMTDPGKMVSVLANAAGVAVLPHRVTHLSQRGKIVDLSGEGFSLQARKVIIAAGAHSRVLARLAGDRIPLDTERGYHVEWDMDVPRLTRPVCRTSRGFYLCPMEGRLRAAGTVELGGLNLPPSKARVTRLIEGARDIFPDLPEPARDWMGFRPSMPDSLPVIGHSRSSAGVIHAFGHGHLGMTLAPVTAQIVSSLVAGVPPARDISAIRPDRFQSAPAR
ncbi:MAG: FAD-binding oxidoreductase [Rhodobacteraceae bacterium]|nr:FAD-binding oxidoreductase [Paracoccaceae bacterium]